MCVRASGVVCTCRNKERCICAVSAASLSPLFYIYTHHTAHTEQYTVALVGTRVDHHDRDRVATSGQCNPTHPLSTYYHTHTDTLTHIVHPPPIPYTVHPPPLSIAAVYPFQLLLLFILSVCTFHLVLLSIAAVCSFQFVCCCPSLLSVRPWLVLLSTAAVCTLPSNCK